MGGKIGQFRRFSLKSDPLGMIKKYDFFLCNWIFFYMKNLGQEGLIIYPAPRFLDPL